MRWEYLIFNLVVAAGPVAASFERNLRFARYWKYAFPAIAVTAVPFIAWDIAVTGKHWHFNELYTLPFRLLSLPAGEWLFFITVPFAALFMWQVLQHYRPQESPRESRISMWIAPLAYIAGAGLLSSGIEYTGLALMALVTALALDSVLRTRVLTNRSILLYIAFIVLATAVFNGYLTARPVVLYNEATMTGLRIGTIPIEDFAYGSALILMATSLFEWFKRRGAHE